MSSIEDKISARIKCRAYKNAESPDARESLCGEKVQMDEEGREYFEIPGHQREYLSKLMPSYTFSEAYDMNDGPADVSKNKGGRPRKAE